MATKQPSTLVEALNAFQKQHHAAVNDGTNPFYKSKYTTLGQALLAIQPATEFGLCHTQLNDFVITPEGEVITIVITKLMHVSGDEPIVSRFPVPKIPSNVKNVHQEAGSAQTYARRYGLLSVYGLANDDDDGNSLTKAPTKEPGTDRTHTKPNQKLEPVSKQAESNPPITSEARTLITDQLKELMQTNPDKAKEIAASFIKEFKVPRVTGFITEARHGEFLSHAISKIADN